MLYQTKITRALGGLALIGAIGFASCQVEELQQRLDDTTINVNTDILNSVLSIEMANALAEQNDRTPGDAVIVLSGPDADVFYTPSGSSDLRASEGLVELAIKKSIEPSVADPLVVDVTVEATGFRPKTQRIYVTDAAQLKTALIQLAPEGIVPEEAAVAEVSLQADAQTGTTAPVTLEADATRDLDMALPAATQLFAADGTALSGVAQLDVTFFDVSTAASLTTFPTSVERARVQNADGDVQEEQTLLPYGYYEAHLTVGNEETKTLSTPLTVSMAIDANAPHPTENRSVQAGDVLPVYSLDEATGTWVYETEATVALENGELVASYEQAHFSKWLLGFFKTYLTPAQQNASLAIQSSVAAGADAPDYAWAVEYRNGAPTLLNSALGSYRRFFDGETVLMSRLAELLIGNAEVVLSVYEGTNQCRGALVATSAPFTLDGATPVDLSGLVNRGLQIDVAVSGICENANSVDVRVKPSGTLYYRDAGCTQYRPLGEVINGTFSTRGLKRDATYDFMGFYDGTRYEYPGVTIETTTFEFNGESIRIGVTGDHVNIEYLDVVIPEEYCALLGG